MLTVLSKGDSKLLASDVEVGGGIVAAATGVLGTPGHLPLVRRVGGRK